jgi:hypothetical protein
MKKMNKCGPAVARFQEHIRRYHGFRKWSDFLELEIEHTNQRLLTRPGESAFEIGPKTWKKMNQEITSLSSSADNLSKEICPGFLDRRGINVHIHPKMYAWKRKWSQITGVTLHQTGCEMPQNPAGWDRLNAHIGITQEGKAIIVNDPTDMIWHAQGLSKSTIGIEIEGNYPGCLDNPEKTLWTFGGGPNHLNDKMIAALSIVREWLSREFSRNKTPWRNLHAHRQSSGSRIADPGEEIWTTIAIPWMAELGLNDGGPDFRMGNGLPIPHEWDRRYSWRYAELQSPPSKIWSDRK